MRWYILYTLVEIILLDYGIYGQEIRNKSISSFRRKNEQHKEDPKIFRMYLPSRRTAFRKSLDEKPKTRSRSKHHTRSSIQYRNAYAQCLSEANVATATSKKRDLTTITGSKGVSYSEGSNNDKTLFCKAKAYELTKGRKGIKRTAQETSSIYSNNQDIMQLLDPKKPKMDQLEVGSKGRSAISGNSDKKSSVSVVDTKDTDAGSSTVTKSKKTPNGLESNAIVQGGTTMQNKGVGIQSQGQEATVVLMNPNKRRLKKVGGNTQDADNVLTYVVQRKQKKFEIDI